MTTPGAGAANKGPLWVAIMAACLPLAACPVAPAMFTATVGARHVGHRLQEGGFTVYLVILAFFISVVSAAVMLFFMARGARVPVPLPVGLAALPWLVGDAGQRAGMKLVQEAIANVSPSDQATILAAGLAEASVNRLAGALFSSVLLGFVGLALSLGAFGRSSKRAVAGAFIGLMASAPLVAAALFVPSLRESGPTGFLPLLPALAALLGLALAAAGASPDAPAARSSALAAGAGVPFGAAFVGAAVAALVAATSSTFAAVAMVSPADRGTVIAAAVLEMRPLVLLSTWGWALAAVPALAVGGWAVMRGATVRAPWGELLAVLLLGGFVAFADLSAARAANEAVDAFAGMPWKNLTGLQPVKVKARAPNGTYAGTALGGRWQPRHGEPLSDAYLPANRLALVKALSPLEGRGLTVGVDARLGKAELTALFEAAAEAGVKTLELAGEPLNGPARPAMSDPTGWMLRLAEQPVAVALELQPSGMAGDRPLIEVHVGARGVVGGLPAFGPQTLVVLWLDDDVTAAALVGVAAEVAEREGSAGLPSAVPSEPEPAARPPPGEDDDAARGPVVLGDLDVATVKRVVQKAQRAMRVCYDAAKKRLPMVAGHMKVKFVVTARGQVATATVASSNLDDPTLEQCVADQVKKLKFPNTKGGGVAVVTYPFAFPRDR